MTFRLSLLIDANAQDAKAELGAVSKAANQAGNSVQKMGQQESRAAASTRGLTTAAGAAEAQVRSMAAANQLAANTNRQLADSQVMAAGSVANLTAQFNDIGVMMAAGQNPLQLALQQGTQITQVFGQAGAGAAVRSLGAAFMSMLSPLNLITIGTIAAGGALVQWLTSSNAEAASFEDRLEELTAGIDAYAEAADLAQLPTEELREKFGAAADEVARFYQEIAAGTRAAAEDNAARTIRAMIDELGFGLRADDASTQSILAKQLELPNPFFGARRREVREVTSEIIADYAALADAADGSVSDQIRALGALYKSFHRGAEASGEISAAEQERLSAISNMIAELNRLRLEQKDDDGFVDQKGIEASRQYYESRIAAEQYLANARAQEIAENERIYAFYARSRTESDAEQSSAQALLGQLQSQVAVRSAIAKFGSDSKQAVEARVAAERRAFEETLATMNVAESLKQELRSAWDAASGLGAVDVAGSISAGANEAARLAEWLGISLKTAQVLAGFGPQGVPGEQQGGRGGDPRKQGGSFFDWQNKEATIFLANWKPPKLGQSGGGRRGGAGKSSAGELSASRELIKSLEQELALLREKDPLQKELLRNSEALAEATNAERRQISDLIAEKLREERATRAQTEAAEEFGRIGYEAIDSLIFESGSLADALENVTESLGKAALQASLLGTGPFANMFGGSEGGGVFGMILGSIFPKAQFGRAEGGAPGPVYGRGSATSDDVPAWLSQSEFVMTGQATRRYRHVLEAMNGGGYVPGFASGGPVGAANAPWAPQINFSLSVENTSSHPVDARLEQDQSQGPGRAMRLVLSDQVGVALAEPNGGAHKTLRRNFGIRQRGTVR